MQRFEADGSDASSEKLWAYIEALKREGGPGTDATNGYRRNGSRPAAGPKAAHGSGAQGTAEIEALLPLAAAVYKAMQAAATSGQSAARARLNAVIQDDLAEAGPEDLPLTFDPTRAIVPGRLDLPPAPRRRPAFFAPTMRLGTRGRRVRGALVALVLLLLALAAFGRLYGLLLPASCHESSSPHGPK